MAYFVQLTTCGPQGEDQEKELINLDRVLRISPAVSPTIEPCYFKGSKIYFSRTESITVVEDLDYLKSRYALNLL